VARTPPSGRRPGLSGRSGWLIPVEPDRWLFPSGAGAGVEAETGTPLPADYRDLIGDGLACVFENELVIWSPFDADPNANLGLRPDRRERHG